MSHYYADIFDPMGQDSASASYAVLHGFSTADDAWRGVQAFLRSDPRWSGHGHIHRAAERARLESPYVAYDLDLGGAPATGGLPVSARVARYVQ